MNSSKFISTFMERLVVMDDFMKIHSRLFYQLVEIEAQEVAIAGLQVQLNSFFAYCSDNLSISISMFNYLTQ